jgi:hypothetical protein
VPIVLKSGSLNQLEPSGPVKGCDGIALPYIMKLKITIKSTKPKSMKIINFK